MGAVVLNPNRRQGSLALPHFALLMGSLSMGLDSQKFDELIKEIAS